ncbi:hypothetical protein ILUMI_01043 [Ignelater luminosus]|uniref:Uncharacterized protein n=1 Tax=Ignelater luminosus TaxID=2038154 RepID=A0A8K0DF47_IGNLU|nr:hypothetical protein ILUMI_01043 [Ignelater luminosus]
MLCVRIIILVVLTCLNDTEGATWKILHQQSSIFQKIVKVPYSPSVSDNYELDYDNAAPIFLQDDGDETDDTIHLPTNNLTVSGNAVESTKGSTTANSLRAPGRLQPMVWAPQICSEGQKFVAGHCRDTFDDYNE